MTTTLAKSIFTNTSPKRIGFVTYDFYPFVGGLGRYAYDVYYKSLENVSNVSIRFFSPCQNKLSNNTAIFPFTKTSSGQNFKNIIYAGLVNLTLNGLIKNYNLDYLAVFTGPGGLFLLKKPRKAKLISIVCHTYHQQSTLIKNQSWKSLLKYPEKRTYDISDHIITISNSTKSALIDNYGVPENKITIISPCVDLDRFKPLPNITKIPKSLFFVARLDKRKGIDTFVEIMPHIIEKDPEIKLYIGGKGNLLSWLENYIRNNNLENNVKLLGFIPDEELNAWYNKTQLFVIPSIFEGFGITAIESLAAGTPVLATQTTGLADILTHTGGGMFIDPINQKDQTVNQIVELINNHQKIYEMSREGIQYVSENYICSTKAEKFIQLIKRIDAQDR